MKECNCTDGRVEYFGFRKIEKGKYKGKNKCNYCGGYMTQDPAVTKGFNYASSHLPISFNAFATLRQSFKIVARAKDEQFKEIVNFTLKEKFKIKDADVIAEEIIYRMELETGR